MPFESAKPWEYQQNCFLKGHMLLNLDMEKYVHIHCLKYSCPLHGWKRKLKLEKGIEKYLSKFTHIRFWTFTLTSKGFETFSDHYRVLSLAFRYFTTYMRRHKSLTESEQDFQYVKVVDLHKSGFIHYHAFFDRYISVYKVRELWTQALQKAGKDNALRGSAWSNRLLNPKLASKYVSKYVVQAAGLVSFRLNYYSKSSRVSLFEKFKTFGKWIHFHPKKTLDMWLNNESPLLVPKIVIVTKCAQLRLMFENCLPTSVKTDYDFRYG